jgi:hypothetical protein
VSYWFLIKNVFSSSIRIVGEKVTQQAKKVEEVEKVEKV